MHNRIKLYQLLLVFVAFISIAPKFAQAQVETQIDGFGAVAGSHPNQANMNYAVQDMDGNGVNGGYVVRRHLLQRELHNGMYQSARLQRHCGCTWWQNQSTYGDWTAVVQYNGWNDGTTQYEASPSYTFPVYVWNY
jgi:hypothetical protein